MLLQSLGAMTPLNHGRWNLVVQEPVGTMETWNQWILRTLEPVLLNLDWIIFSFVKFQSGYGPTVAALTSTDSVSANDYCGDDAIGYYEEYETADYRYVIISGAPSHEAEYDQEHANPNIRCK